MSKWKKDQEVTANRDVGSGVFGNNIPEGTKGEVVESREGLLDDYATVRFDNGYTEEVRASDLQRHSWW